LQKWNKENRQKINEYLRFKREENPEKFKEKVKEWRANHPEKCREWQREWRKNNPEKAREAGRRGAAARRNNPKYRLSNSMSSGILQSIKQGTKANRRWESLVDFTISQLRVHLEQLFKPGWTWENYGTVWHIDHKTPIAVFNFNKPEDIDFRICWSLKNLQPMDAMENKIKKAKIDKPFQPSLAIGG
jgi:uncharacterized protein YdiU (UPF0061 family)